MECFNRRMMNESILIIYKNEDVVERMNKGVSLCAFKYRLLSVLNISPFLMQSRLIRVIMLPV